MSVTPYTVGQFSTIYLPNYAGVCRPGVFGLNYANRDVTVARSELGLRTDKSFVTGGGLVTLRG